MLSATYLTHKHCLEYLLSTTPSPLGSTPLLLAGVAYPLSLANGAPPASVAVLMSYPRPTLRGLPEQPWIAREGCRLEGSSSCGVGVLYLLPRESNFVST
jgi:hypothetical protein